MSMILVKRLRPGGKADLTGWDLDSLVDVEGPKEAILAALGEAVDQGLNYDAEVVLAAVWGGYDNPSTDDATAIDFTLMFQEEGGPTWRFTLSDLITKLIDRRHRVEDKSKIRRIRDGLHSLVRSIDDVLGEDTTGRTKP